MPYVANDQEDENTPGGTNTNASQGPISPGGAGGVHLAASSAPASGGAATSTTSKGAGGQFASLGDYLTANQGQAQPLANKISGGIQNQYNTLDQQNQSVLGNLNNSVINASGYAANNPSLLSQESANPTSFASDPNNVKQFQSLLNDSYSGPTSAESDAGYQNQQAAVNTAIAQGQAATQTPAGQQQLVAQNSARPTQGVTALNSAILSEDPNALGQIQNSYTPFSNLVSGLSSGASNIDQTIAKQQSDATTANQAANSALSGQISGLNSGVNTALQTQQTQYDAYNKASQDFASSLQNGTLPTGEGVDPGLQAFLNNQVNPWFQANAPQYANSTAGMYNFANAIPQMATLPSPSLSTAATPQQFALYNALNSLSGSPISSPLTGVTASTTPYTSPTLPTVDNKALAGDLESGLTNGTNVQVGAQPFNQFQNLLDALQIYQGKTPQYNDLQSGGPGSPFLTPPTIA